MLDLALIRAEPARVKASLARRGMGPEALDAVLAFDGRLTAREEVRDALRLRRRRISEEFAQRKHALRAGPDWGPESLHAPDLERAGRDVAVELHAVGEEIARLEAGRDQALAAVPNLVATDVPDADAEPAPPPPWPHAFHPLAHWDLLEMLGLVRRGETPSGGRGFLVWRGQGARLVRALEQLMLDVHTREGGCEEVLAPSLATREALTGSAHLPLLEERMYAVGGDPSRAPGAGHDLFLAPRAEPHLAGLYAGQVLDGERLPERLVAAGRAFRREVGGHGRSSRGLLRLHEFPTVEVYTFCRADQGDAELARAVASAETILARLEVPYRRLVRPAPRLSHAAAKTVDLEVWAPGVGEWLGVAALSSFTDYQARRTETRYRGADGRPRLAHTVGGAAVALPHLLAAILENGQQKDGAVRLPAALTPYFGGDTLRV